MALQPFSWGANGQKATPSSVKKQAEIAAALAARGGSPSNVGEGLNRIGEALLANSYSSRAAAGEEEGAASRKAVMDALMGNPDPTMQDLAGAMGNEWVTSDPGSSAILQALMGAEIQQNDPLRQQQLAMGEIELENARNPPPAKPIEVGGVLVDPVTFEPVFDSRKPDPGYRLMSPEEVQSVPGLDPMKAYQVGPDNKVYEIGGGGTNVSISTGAQGPKLGSLSTDYGYVMDPATGEAKIDPETGLPTAAAIPGSPAALEAAAAAAAAEAQQGAQITSDMEGAETTLSTTRAVLDILDNSDQPTTGTNSRPFALHSATPAGKIRSYVSTLQSGVALGAMQRLKELSSTGATGFGALSAPELNLLINDIGALDPDNTEPDIFRNTVERIDNRAKRVVADIKRNVSPERIQELGLQPLIDAFGGDDAPGQSSGVDYNAPEPPEGWGGDPALWRHMPPEDRALW